MNQLPLLYDYIAINPPWIPAKPVGDLGLGLGVCDEEGRMLIASLRLASNQEER